MGGSGGEEFGDYGIYWVTDTKETKIFKRKYIIFIIKLFHFTIYKFTPKNKEHYPQITVILLLKSRTFTIDCRILTKGYNLTLKVKVRFEKMEFRKKIIQSEYKIIIFVPG